MYNSLSIYNISSTLIRLVHCLAQCLVQLAVVKVGLPAQPQTFSASYRATFPIQPCQSTTNPKPQWRRTRTCVARTSVCPSLVEAALSCSVAMLPTAQCQSAPCGIGEPRCRRGGPRHSGSLLLANQRRQSSRTRSPPLRVIAPSSPRRCRRRCPWPPCLRGTSLLAGTYAQRREPGRKPKKDGHIANVGGKILQGWRRLFHPELARRERRD